MFCFRIFCKFCVLVYSIYSVFKSIPCIPPFRSVIPHFPPFLLRVTLSVRFRSKKGGKGVKERMKYGTSKRAGRERLSFHFSCGQNRESRYSVFLYSETKRKRLLRRLLLPPQGFRPEGEIPRRHPSNWRVY